MPTATAPRLKCIGNNKLTQIGSMYSKYNFTTVEE